MTDSPNGFAQRVSNAIDEHVGRLTTENLALSVRVQSLLEENVELVKSCAEKDAELEALRVMVSSSSPEPAEPTEPAEKDELPVN